MKDTASYWYNLPYSCTTQNVSLYRPIFGEHGASGWNSNLIPPSIEEKFEIYDNEGKPFTMGLHESTYNSSAQSLLDPMSSLAQVPPINTCGLNCHYQNVGTTESPDYVCLGDIYMNYSGCPISSTYFTDPTGCGTPGGNSTNIPLFYIKRLKLRFSDGSTSELRTSDTPISCGTSLTGCSTDPTGTYLSVDGSGLRIERTSISNILYTSDGDQFHFPTANQHQSSEGKIYYATSRTDANGNLTAFAETQLEGSPYYSTTDTMGRQLADTLPLNFGQAQFIDGPIEQTKTFTFSTTEGNSQTYTLEWQHLKPVSCPEGTSTNCGNPDGALEDQSQPLYFYTSNMCFGNLTKLVEPNGNTSSPANLHPEHIMFPQNGTGLRACNPIESGLTFETIVAKRFNPVVLAKISLPNGQKYEFKYNQFGEITKLVHPSGAYETFRYAAIEPLNRFDNPVYDQTNRGVVEHRVYQAGGMLSARTSYSATYTAATNDYKVTTIVAKSSSDISAEPMVSGSRKETTLDVSTDEDVRFGFSRILAGRPIEERSFDENGEIRTRTITESILKSVAIGGFPTGPVAERDARPKRSVTISFEPGSTTALATYSETEFDETGSTDPEFFSHLNVKRKKAYNYAAVTAANVDNEALAWSTIASWFPSSELASVSETVYSYDANYKARGIIGLATETRVLDPTNTNNVLGKTQTVFDNALPSSSSGYGYSMLTYGTGNSYNCTTTATCWLNPNGSGGNVDMSYRGLPTTSRVWVKETDTWIDSHVQYDQFGNAVKAKDPIGNEASTVFSSEYKYAYPTSVTTPAPDPTNTTGTNQTSTSNTTYDFNTGLPLTVTNDFGQTTGTEYADPLLRPTRSFAVNFSAPESQTVYNDGARTFTVRKQLDGGNWDEATTFADTLGRTIKTVAKDSQGDVIVETHYDLLGRVDRVSSPYRANETAPEDVLWSKTRYDVAGRAVETFAPAKEAHLASATSLGVTSFAISDVTNYVGTVVTTKDVSGRRGRSITNALGQLIRVDEPTGISASEDSDLGALATPVQATSYKYDVFGKMVEVTQGVQKRWFKYDALGRLLRVSQPEQERNPNLDLSDSYNTTGYWTAGFTYDLLGNVLTATDANGTVITNTYDRAGRVTSRTYSNEPSGVTTPSVDFRYDGKGLPAPQNPNFAKGKLTKVSSSVSATEYQLFDSFGRVTQAAQITDGNTYTSRYTYNFSGALVEEKYPSGRKVTNEFEPDGDLAKVTSKKNPTSVNAPFVSNFSYTASGGISQMKLGNGRWETAKFNNRMQVTELGLGASASDAGTWKTQYEYGELNSDGTVNTNKNTGNIAKQTLSFNGITHPLVQSYKYDALYRIKEATETANSVANWFQVWDYDRYGNRTSFTQNIGGNPASVNPAIVTATNRFDETGTNFDYDLNGNLIRDGEGREFKFNGDNKQTVVKDANNNIIGQYFYDGEGKRVKKISNSETTIFVYSSGKLVAEYSSQVSTTPSVSYTTTDHLGTPRIITDAIGQVKSRRDFLPFGEDLLAGVGSRTTANRYGATSDDVRQKFTGYQKDTETSLDFAEARMYDNRFGRFTAVDPLLASGKSANPQTFNRFVYVGNSPLVITDPMGLDWYKKYNEEKKLWEYNETGGDGWDPVGFGENSWTTVSNWCWNGDCGDGNQTAYLYKSGGWDNGYKASNIISRILSDAGIGTAQWAWNNAVWANNSFYWLLSRPSPFAYNGSTTPAPFQMRYWEAETDGQVGTQMGLTGISLYFGAVAASRPRPVPIAGFTTARTVGAGTSPTVQYEQYALRAVQDGMYPVMQRGFKDPVGSVFLKEGQVWKFGQTFKEEARYSGAFYKNTGAGLRFDSQYSTSILKDVLQTERQQLLTYKQMFNKLPPGNKITR